MASGIYNCGLEDMADHTANYESGGDSFKVALLNNSHSFTATHTTWANISTNEISGTGYTAGGEALAGQAITESTGTVKWDATDTAWGPGASFTAYWAAIYNVTNSDSLVCTFDFGGAQQVTNGTFTIQWDASNGIFTLASA